MAEFLATFIVALITVFGVLSWAMAVTRTPEERKRREEQKRLERYHKFGRK